MNIDDVIKKIPIPEDPIAEIFRMQQKLMNRYDDIERDNGFHVPEAPYHLDNAQVQARIKDMFWRVTEEIMEAMEAITTIYRLLEDWQDRWEGSPDIRHFFEELADALHFLTEASILAGLEASDISLHYSRGKRLNTFTLTESNLKVMCFNIIYHMGIAANHFKNKPWKQTQMPTDKVRFKDHLLLVWKSFKVMWDRLDCDLEHVYVLYARKNFVNVWRQDTNY